jgi:hypothetical protein
MLRLLVLIAGLTLAAGITSAAQGRTAAPGAPVLQSELRDMTSRLDPGRSTPGEAIANAQWLVGRYRTLGPLARTFAPADLAVSREMARRSLVWLGRAGALHARDPLVARALLDAYEVTGGFYRDHGRLYMPGAYVAYASAARLAQRLTFYRADPLWFGRAFDRYALAYGALAVADGTFVPRWTTLRDLPESDPSAAGAATPLAPVPLPAVDVGSLETSQRQAWSDARDRFRSVAANVHAARLLLDQLSERLHARGLALNPDTAATALKMQSALEDAAELLRSHEFDTAIDALRGAEAHRARLKGATGQ